MGITSTFKDFDGPLEDTISRCYSYIGELSDCYPNSMVAS